MRHTRQVQEERLVGDSDAQGHGKLHLGAFLAVLGRVENHLERHHAGLLVGHLYAYGAFQHKHTHALGRQGHRNILFQALYLGDAGALCQAYLVERDGRALLGGDALYLDLVAAQSVDDAVLVALHLVQGDFVPLVLIVVQQIHRRELVFRKVQAGVVEMVHLVCLHIGLGVIAAVFYRNLYI